MLDYIKKYQAGGQIDTDKLSEGLRDDERFYKKGNFTSAGRARLKAIKEIEKNQSAGISYNADIETNTFNTLDSEGNEIQVDSGMGRGLDSNSPIYGAFSKDKRVKSQVSELVGLAYNKGIFSKKETKPKLQPKSEVVNTSNKETAPEKQSKSSSITAKDSVLKGENKSTVDKFWDSFGATPDIRIPKVGVKLAPSGRSSQSNGYGTTNSGEDYTPTSLTLSELRDKTGDYLSTIENIESEVQKVLQSDMYNKFNIPSKEDFNLYEDKSLDSLKEDYSRAQELLKEAKEDDNLPEDKLNKYIDLTQKLKTRLDEKVSYINEGTSEEDKLERSKASGFKGRVDIKDNVARSRELYNQANEFYLQAKEGKLTDKPLSDYIRLKNARKKILDQTIQETVKDKASLVATFLNKKRAEAKKWSYNSEDEKFSTLEYLDKARNHWAEVYDNYSKTVPTDEDIFNIFGELDKEAPRYNFDKKYDYKPSGNKFKVIPVAPVNSKKTIERVKEDPNKLGSFGTWASIAYPMLTPQIKTFEHVMKQKNGGELPKFQLGGNVSIDDFTYRLFDNISNNRILGTSYYGPNRPIGKISSELVEKPKVTSTDNSEEKNAVIPKINSNLVEKPTVTSSYEEPGLVNFKTNPFKQEPKMYPAPEKEQEFDKPRDSTEYDKSKINTGFGLGQTGFNTPVGQIQYNDVGQFILATIAKNKKVDEIDPFYEKFQESGSRNVLAARDLDSGMTTARQNQIANTRSQYSGSDPVMDMISKNITESQKSVMKDQLLAERSNYRRSEEDRVDAQMEEKRQQQVSNLLEKNAVNNRNLERKMGYDSMKAQEKQRVESEYMSNIGSIMSDMQGRSNVNAAKERDLAMGAQAQKHKIDYSTKSNELSGYTEKLKLAELNGDQAAYNKYGKLVKDTQKELDALGSFDSNTVLNDYNKVKKNQKLIRRQN